MENPYRREAARSLADAFRDPRAIFRGAPFWSWNGALDQETLLTQIDIFKEMGIGGFHMHSRVGLATEYLGDVFLDAARACVEKARAEGMLAWLYDEDRWPSGAGGGRVTADPQYRQRSLLLRPGGAEDAGVLARYAVRLDRDGCLAASRLLAAGESAAADEKVWTAEVVVNSPSTWFNGQTYLDTLNPKAVDRFIECTHEVYKRALGDEFGQTIPAIFTDEPHFRPVESLATPWSTTPVWLPYTDDFPATYEAAYGAPFLPTLPEVLWELPGQGPSLARYRFFDHLAERFATAFCDTIGRWCGANHLWATGHLNGEDSLTAQTQILGEAMRSYRAFHLPGIDMLRGRHHFVTAKQAQSAARQYGRPGILSELYGVTGWYCDFAEYKSQGDWQAALGVTLRVHHLAWMSMRGEAKRDYPASIFFQSPWWKRFRVVEDHFARVNAALTRGTPRVRLAMIHPIESFWLDYGVASQTDTARRERESDFANAAEWLLRGQLDFDYLCESLLPDLCATGNPVPGAGFRVGEMTYDTVLVPPLRTLRASTLERLRAFRRAGGRVLFAGEIPEAVDARPSADVRAFAETCERTPFTRAALWAALEPLREVDVRRANGDGQDGTRFDDLVYQLRQDGAEQILFLARLAKTGDGERGRIRLPGEWAVDALDSATGDIRPIGAEYAEGHTEIVHTFFPQGHLLLRLAPGPRAGAGGAAEAAAVARAYREEDILLRFPDRNPVTLDEPNAMLLDQAEWRLDGTDAPGAWRPKEELLRIGVAVRKRLGWDKFGGSRDIVQPWVNPPDDTVGAVVELRFRWNAEVPVNGAKLAIELAEGGELWLDDAPVATRADGWWVDPAITTLPLPPMAAGLHELRLRVPMRVAFSLEWCYVLGDFGVRAVGREATLTAPVRELAFGDITGQGLPFYTGNLTYHCTVESPIDDPVLRVGPFHGALVDVQVDGAPPIPVAYAPYRCALTGAGRGRHRIDLICYGTRHNAFGALHWATPDDWPGPYTWRTGGDAWCYEYRLRPAGIPTAPALAAP